MPPMPPLNDSNISVPMRLPSCDPCRQSKLACDHKRPRCTRCLRRGKSDDCVYRSSPFKRTRNATSRTTLQPRLVSPLASNKIHSGVSRPELARTGRNWSVGGPVVSQNFVSQPPPCTTFPNPGFQGLSSSAMILRAVDKDAQGWTDPDPHQHPNGPSPMMLEGELSNQHKAGGAGSTIREEGAHILDMFSQFITSGIFKALFDNWSHHDLDGRLGAFLVPRFLETMTSDLGHLGPSADRHSELLRMSQRLIAASRVPLEFHDAMTLREFVDCHVGQNLRWEAVGAMLSLAGIAMCDIRAPHPACATEDERQSLKKCLFHASTLCAQFCESLETLNDVLVIFLYENFLLYSLHLGDQSFQTWRRLNDAINAMFAHGLHQKLDSDLHTPFFLVELRKHIFARVYASDISFAVFLGRPPRVSQRYCIIHRPLDLKADAYEMTGEALEGELAHLDQREWNTSSEVRLHAVLRWSVTMCKIREEMLEAILGLQVTDRQQLIRTLRIKVENAWNELPEYLTITASDIWARNRPGTVVDSLYLIRLFYLQAVFFIEWTASIHGNVDNDTLYIISSDLLSWVNEAMLRRERLSKLGLSSLAWRAVTCGLPAAATLAKYMIPGSPQPSRKWRDANAFAKVIQDLSVFIRHMDYLHEPGDANYEIFRQAKAVLQRVIATRLDSHTLLEERELQTCPTPIFPPDMLSIDQWVLRPEFWMEFEHPVMFDTISHSDTQHID